MAFTPLQGPLASNFDIPIIGSHIAKIGRIIDLYSMPCAPTPEIWAKALWQATPTAILTYAKPELWDVGIPDHRKNNKKRPKGVAGALLKMTDSIVEVPLPRWRVFRAFELSELAGLYLFLADIAEDAVINWMSLAYEYTGCQDQFQAYAYRDHADHSTEIPMGGSVPATPWGTIAGKNFDGNPQVTIPRLPGEYTATARIQAIPHPTLQPAGQLLGYSIRDRQSGVQIAFTETDLQQDGANAGRLLGRFKYDGGDPPWLDVLLIGAPGWILVQQGSQFNVVITLDANLGVDP